MILWHLLVWSNEYRRTTPQKKKKKPWSMSSYSSNICFNLRKITELSIVFENLDVQFGNDRTGVPTYMLSLNSTIKIMYTNHAAFFGVYVTSTLLQLRYYDLTPASGQVPPSFLSLPCSVFYVIISKNWYPTEHGLQTEPNLAFIDSCLTDGTLASIIIKNSYVFLKNSCIRRVLYYNRCKSSISQARINESLLWFCLQTMFLSTVGYQFLETIT